MIVAVAVLMFAVFSWGVRYKISLYNPMTHMSAAKLLSQRERAVTSEAEKLAADPLANPAPVAWFAIAMGVTLFGLDLLKPVFCLKDVWNREELPQQSSHTFFFFRPPPFLFASI